MWCKYLVLSFSYTHTQFTLYPGHPQLSRVLREQAANISSQFVLLVCCPTCRWIPRPIGQSPFDTHPHKLRYQAVGKAYAQTVHQNVLHSSQPIKLEFSFYTIVKKNISGTDYYCSAYLDKTKYLSNLLELVEKGSLVLFYQVQFFDNCGRSNKNGLSRDILEPFSSWTRQLGTRNDVISHIGISALNLDISVISGFLLSPEVVIGSRGC